MSVKAPESSSYKGIILAGGSGTRLYPVTHAVCKSLLNLRQADGLLPAFHAAKQYKANGLPQQYAPVILHRRSNVDKDESLQSILRCLAVNQRLDLIFPVHPQTRQRNDEFGIDVSGLQLLDTVLYVEFLSLRRHATLVITDSGVIQQETTFLRLPCLFESTERPITDVLVGCNANGLAAEVSRIWRGC